MYTEGYRRFDNDPDFPNSNVSEDAWCTYIN